MRKISSINLLKNPIVTQTRVKRLRLLQVSIFVLMEFRILGNDTSHRARKRLHEIPGVAWERTDYHTHRCARFYQNRRSIDSFPIPLEVAARLSTSETLTP